MSKPTDFPTNIEIDESWYQDEDVWVIIPEKRDEKQKLISKERKVTVSMNLSFYPGGHVVVRRTTNDGEQCEYRLLDDAEKELIACNGKVPSIQATFQKDGTLGAFQMRVPRHSPLEDLNNGTDKMSCQNAVLALHGVDMTGVGKGRYAHNGDHTKLDVRFNFPWVLRRIPAFLNSLRKGSFGVGVHNIRSQDEFRIPLYKMVKALLVENEIEDYDDLPDDYKLLGFYTHPYYMAGVYTFPVIHQHVDVYFLKRAIGRCALTYIRATIPKDKGAFTEVRPSDDRKAPITRCCFDEMMAIWDPPANTPVPATATELIERIRNGDFGKPAYDVNPDKRFKR